LLDDDVGMALNLALLVKKLGSSKVILSSVDKEAGLHVADRHLDGESSVGFDGPKVRRVHELRRGHIGAGRNDTHRSRVAGPCLDLLTVGKGQIDSQAEINEVVRRR